MLTYSNYYEAFNRKGIDYRAIEQNYLKFASSYGIYPDTGYLLYKIASHPNINTISEIGAGLSTCVLSLVEKDFLSLEPSSEWRETVSKICPEAQIVYPPKSIPPMDMFFIDGLLDNNSKGITSRLDALTYYKYSLTNTILIFDDAQWMKKELTSLYPNGLWYNPTGRLDRHQFISIPESKLYILGLVNNALD